MQKSKKRALIIFLVIVILLIVGLMVWLWKSEKYMAEAKEDSFAKIVRVLDSIPTEEEMNQRREYVQNILDTQESIVENVLIEDQYAPISIVLENGEVITYQLGYKGDMSVSLLVEAIGNIIGYEIKVNNIDIGNRTLIKIDFSREGAPFNIDTHINGEATRLDLNDYTQAQVAKCVFDSIKLTVKANYGQEKEVIYSVDKSNIEIEGLDKIQKNKIY